MCIFDYVGIKTKYAKMSGLCGECDRIKARDQKLCLVFFTTASSRYGIFSGNGQRHNRGFPLGHIMAMEMPRVSPGMAPPTINDEICLIIAQIHDESDGFNSFGLCRTL